MAAIYQNRAFALAGGLMSYLSDIAESHRLAGGYVVGLSAGGAMAAAMLAVYPERFAGGAIVAGVPYGCAHTVTEALQCMNPGIDRAPSEWGRRVVDMAAAAGRNIPSISIWHGTADTPGWSHAIGKSLLSSGPQFMAYRRLPRAMSATDQSRASSSSMAMAPCGSRAC